MRSVLRWRHDVRHGAGWVTVMLAALAIVLLVLLVSSTASACPTCKAALASHDASHGDLVSGFFWSILFMMSMPFLILASIGTYMYVLVRKAQAALRQTPPTTNAVEAAREDEVVSV